jgi:hypothetical protein
METGQDFEDRVEIFNTTIRQRGIPLPKRRVGLLQEDIGKAREIGKQREETAERLNALLDKVIDKMLGDTEPDTENLSIQH